MGLKHYRFSVSGLEGIGVFVDSWLKVWHVCCGLRGVQFDVKGLKVETLHEGIIVAM